MLDDLKQRLITAIWSAPLVLAAIWFGGVWFFVFLALIGFIFIWEWGRLIDKDNSPLLSLLYIACLGALLFLLWQDFRLDEKSLLTLGIGVVGVLLMALVSSRARKATMFASLGVIYLLLPLLLLADLRSDDVWGAFALLAFLALVWTSDSGCYIVGRLWGGKKLAPSISENKTWSGFFGGIGSCLILATILVYLAHLSWVFLLWALIISLATQLGDLVESYIKRLYGVKDVSGLLPGHGGLLDRADGLIFALFIFYGVIGFLNWLALFAPALSAAEIFLGR